MRIGLANYEFKNGDMKYNIAQIERGLKAAQGKIDLICFGEAFLQGFDALSWSYETDRDIAITQDSEVMRHICELTTEYGVDLLFGYIERDGDTLYSSCAMLEAGHIAFNYRRISRGWKEFSITDHHYREGDTVDEFTYRGHRIMLALCGDMWDHPESFRASELLIWPVFVEFSLEEWKETEEAEYAQQALLSSDKVLMINSICYDTGCECIGGSFYFRDGHIAAQTGYGAEALLTVEI